MIRERKEINVLSLPPNDFRIIVYGDYACYTRPELKTERVSYDVPTPGAIEGMLKAIYWKPSMRFVVDEIVVFNPIRFLSIRRNEVKEKVSMQKMKAKMEGKDRDPSIYRESCINQRYSLILRDVKYGIRFHIELTGFRSDRGTESIDKHVEIMDRRLKNGQFFKEPCFGCSEYPVQKVDYLRGDSFPLDEISPEIKEKNDVDLGFMLYQLEFVDKGIPVNHNWNHPVFSDTIRGGRFYRPHMVSGLIDVQKYRREALW